MNIIVVVVVVGGDDVFQLDDVVFAIAAVGPFTAREYDTPPKTL